MPDYSEQLNRARTKENTEVNETKASNSNSKITDVEFFLVFCLAALKDAIDIAALPISLFTFGIGLFFSQITNIVITGILGFWCLMRLHKFPIKRFVGSFFIEIVVGNFSPTWTLFIVTVWIEQKGYLPKWTSKLIGAKE